MKKIKILSIAILVVLIGVMFTACAPFDGFDDDKAIVKGNSFPKVGSIENKTSSTYSLSCKKCNGVERLKDVTVSENPEFDIELEIKSGRFKVVAVKDNEVFVICDKDTQSPVKTELEAGTYNLRIVAEDAEVVFKINY